MGIHAAFLEEVILVGTGLYNEREAPPGAKGPGSMGAELAKSQSQMCGCQRGGGTQVAGVRQATSW